jgi:hypothetical protein
LIDEDEIAIAPQAAQIVLADRAHRLRCRAAGTAFEPEHRIRQGRGALMWHHDDVQQDLAASLGVPILEDLKGPAPCATGACAVTGLQCDAA